MVLLNQLEILESFSGKAIAQRGLVEFVHFFLVTFSFGAESMSRILNLILISQVAMLFGCAFKEGTGPQKPTTKPIDVIETIEKGREAQVGELILSAEDVKLSFEESPFPDQYIAKINWPSKLKRVILTKATDLRPRVFVNEIEFKEEVRGGSKVSYGFQVQDALGVSLFSIEIEGAAPKDRVVGDTLVLMRDELWEYSRIFFLSNGRIVLNGFDFSMRAKRLVVSTTDIENQPPDEYSQIRSNNPLAQLKPGQRAEGSKINIDIERAEGHLYVHLAGAKGVPGKSGLERAKEMQVSLTTPNPSQAGAPGEAGQSLIRAVPCARGTMGDVPCDQPTGRCLAPPTNGKPGLKGQAGIAGGDGGKGGGTGSIYFNIKDHSQFKATVYYSRGEGGDPGVGSPGFVGGVGGPPGTPSQGCPNATPGPQGPQGDHGANGAKGDRGQVGDMIGNGVNLIPVPYEFRDSNSKTASGAGAKPQ